MSGTAELLDRVLRNEIDLREYERLCGLPPMEEDEDLIAEMEEYAREFDPLMNPADLYKAIVSAWPLLNDLLIVGVAVALIVATVTCVFREFGTRRVKFL